MTLDTVASVAQAFANASLRQQRASGFYSCYRRFSTLTPAGWPAAALHRDEPDSRPEPAAPSATALGLGTSPETSTSGVSGTEEGIVTSAVPSEAVARAVPAVKSKAESRMDRKLRRMTSGAYRPMIKAKIIKEHTTPEFATTEAAITEAATTETVTTDAATTEMVPEALHAEELQGRSVLAELDDLEAPAPMFADEPQSNTQAQKQPDKDNRGTRIRKLESTRPSKPPPRTKRDPWELQKDALEHKFGETGWQPRKRLSPDTLDGIRALHASDPATYPTEMLSEHFKVAPEAIRRILKSKWRPNEGETEDRRARWERRGVKKWSEMAEIGMRPPVKWRAMGVGGAEGVKEERVPKRKKVRRDDGGLSWDEVVAGIEPLEEGRNDSLADRLL
ncbi:Required for respiratory growth protein 9 mitochondrial [Teratosphaeriaceae sp. CCFEE 6253]|nr:Required for respiratory growth protein 9 mitochondrial [Teratosphaeriaceae sp. CCFEE 6253]